MPSREAMPAYAMLTEESIDDPQTAGIAEGAK